MAKTNQFLPKSVTSSPTPITVFKIIKNTAPIKNTTKCMYKRFFEL